MKMRSLFTSSWGRGEAIATGPLFIYVEPSFGPLEILPF